ncbi:outer kinetochore KNL1 complex subunit KNL1 isoform X2 [Saimiri boliviensis]|uniref:outer kinetochore KNL1 complex subunit KNL1 isoform X2 n=1 Tax=Saimiri boliviensis TaxID=27679 RepID=UPI00193EA920|nr:kinetochore scaffold 1 isoform X2 [Saimiri boliviensis boliviensis]
MDGVSSEAGEENDNTERPVRRQHSSILKPPRSPLQDLRGGNEAVQESNALRNKKNSRRVSFADTIKVFQTESHMEIVRKSEMAETEAGESLLIQNKKLEDNDCEITGMNTLLSAPIHTQMQQKEFSVIEHNHERKHANDETVIFSDENQMDLTSSHTVMITKGLLDNPKSEKFTKIDTTSFLANLKLHTEDSRMKKELNFSMDQNTSSEKKINFNDFIKRLKTGKCNAFPNGPDKENFEIPIYSDESHSTSSSHQMHVSLNEDENNSNITRIFREKDDGMNFTHCHTANIQTLIPTSRETNSQESKGNDITIYGSDVMDLTLNHTIQILPATDNFSKIENQTQNAITDVTRGYGTKASGKKKIFKSKQNAAFQDPSINPADKIPITTRGAETHIVSHTCTQDDRILAMTPESICSNSAIQGCKTVFYSSRNDTMEMTKCLSSMREEKNLLKHDSNYSKIYCNPDAMSCVTEKTIYSEEDIMDITKSHTVAIDNQIFKQDESNVQIAAALPPEKEMMLQNHMTTSEDGKTSVNCNSVPLVSKERIQQSLSNILSISLTDRKTELLAGEDMDLTESHTSNLGSQVPLATYSPAPENTSESHSHSKSYSDKCQKMTKSHTEPFQQPDIISKNSLTNASNKDKEQILKILPYLDKDFPQSADCNQDMATSHNIVYPGGVLDKQVANRNTVSCEQSLFSTTKQFSSGQSSMKIRNTTISSHTVKSLLGPNSKLAEPLRKSLSNPTSDFCHDNMIMCSEEEQNMDLTKSHTVIIGFGPSELQKLGKTNLEHTVSQQTTSRQTAVKVEKCGKSPIERSGVLISNSIMDVLEDESVQKSEFPEEKQNVKIWGRKSVGGLKIDKTIVFSEDKNDTDITKSYTVEINHRPLLDKHDCHLVPLAGTSETILYTCGQDDMEMTRSHTTALGCKTVSPDEITTRPMNKTVSFVDNHDELEMTKSHTVFIDYQEKERTVLPNRPNFELSQRKSLGTPEVLSTPTEESVFLPENDENDSLVASDSQLTPLEEWSNNRCPVGVADNMEISKSTTWKNFKDVQNRGFLNEPLSAKSQRRKSFKLKNDKTIVFSENDQNDMDITQSCMVEIDNKSTLEDKEDFHLVPLAGASKTILYSCGQDDMEITRSHTTTLECKAVLPNEIVTRPMDKTVIFTDNHNDLDVTTSHTAFIECQATEKILEENPKFGITKGKNLGVSFPKDNSCVQEITEKQALDVENKIVLHTEQKQQCFASANTLSGDQGEMEIIKFHSAAMDEKVTGKVVDQACTLEKAQIESCQLNNRDRRNVDFTSSHATAVCGSSDNYSCFPNVINYTDNLEGSAMPLCDKDKEKANNCPVQNDLAPICENKPKMLNNEKWFAEAYKKELKENTQTTNYNTALDFHSNSDLTKQVIQTHVNARKAPDPAMTSNIHCLHRVKPNLNDLNGKTEAFQTVHVPPPPEQLLELGNKAHNGMSVVQATEKLNINIIFSNAKDSRGEENKKTRNGAETTSLPLKTVIKDKVRRCSLGIFLPRLPNKRNCSVTGIDDLEQIPAYTTDLNHLETQPVSSTDSGIGSVAAKLNLSPSQYINEENLPIYPDEINSSDSINIETEEKALIETYQKEISPYENKMEKTLNSQKRTWVQEEEEDTQKEKKIRKNEITFSDTAQDQEIFDHRTEEHIDKNANSVLIKSLSRTPSSCSSSLDSIKADGTSLDFSTYHSSQMESQFLRDTICEESLREKLKDGRITIREFFILLQVHILIQKPRQSNLPGNFTVNTPPTPEDLMLSQYVYRPKIQIYRQDCEARRQKIEELKLSASNQDKLLADINKNLWEKMRHCSDEELQAFGIYLNKIKSRFTKMTKVFTHQGKVALYGKLVQSAQNEREKLQTKIHEMDKILKKIDNCLTEVEIETKNLEDEQKDNLVEEWDSEMRTAEKELEQLKTEEEEFQRNLLELEVQKEQTLVQIDFMQKQTNRTEELLDQLSLSEWDVVEWSDDQAVFTFVYDSIELTITFGESVVGLPFLDNRYVRKIIDVNFQSLLDEDEAPPSSLLVHKLIFQYIEEKESWKKTCATQHQVPKMLQEFSLVVNHCRLLGEEIEYLKTWGPNYNLMNIDVNNIELRLLFSSSAAFAKFEITLFLSAHYPSVPLPFTIRNHIGNTSQDDIATILSKVPLENNYLKNVVKQIYQDLLQDCHFYH